MSDSLETDAKKLRGPIAWMASNSVAANLLMVALLAGGMMLALTVKQEVFPEFDADIVRITIPYPGATPQEVEQGILLAAEEAVQGIDGVKRVTAQATEGFGIIVVELLTGVDTDQALADVKNEIDRITSFPLESEEPTISKVTNRNQAISVVVHGELPVSMLRGIAERIRSELIELDDIILVDIANAPPLEISIEVPRSVLRAYGITLDQIAAAVRGASIELTGGAVRTEGGEILIRTDERRDAATEFADIIVLSTPDGGRIRLGDIAEVRDAYQQTDQEAYYNGEQAVMIDVYRVGNQTPTDVATAVLKYVEEVSLTLPSTVSVSTWNDQSEIFTDRMSLLTRNGAVGLVLVFLVLGAFLELRLAFWVMLGIPISILGAFLIFPFFGVSINMISLFAFIITLGIVVDDAIVVGENVYHNQQQGMKPLHAAIEGARQVSMPVTFAILTTIAAFSPMLSVPGFMGKIFGVIPIIVIAVLVLSLVESLFILPAHLAHASKSDPHGFWEAIRRPQKRISLWLEWFVENTYRRYVRVAIHFRYITIAIAIATLLASVGLVAGGHVPFVFFPKIESDIVGASVRLPVGASIEEARRIRDYFVQTGREVIAEHENDGVILRGMYAQIGKGIPGFGMHDNTFRGENGAHVVDVAVRLVPWGDRDVTASEIARLWRERAGVPAGINTISFTYSTGPGAGAAMTIQLRHSDTDVLEAAAGELAEQMSRYEGVSDVDPGYANGKPQIDLSLKPAARALGLTEAGMARQVRSALFGAEALRQQRGRDEVRVMVRLPEADRARLYGLEQYRLRTPQGVELPLSQAATLSESRAYTSIRRVNGSRVLNVLGDTEEGAVPDRIIERIEAEVLPELIRKYPDLRYSFEGVQADQRDSMASLGLGFLGAIIAIFALLAIPFRSYVQPIIVMTAIPFGLIGALLGHLLLGYDVTIISIMGLVALAGVVVNDSLVLIVRVNEFHSEGLTAYEAVIEAGVRRFRPILLTSLTTFFGLAPLIFETSVQARFLIPMAISLGFGILATTGIVLILVPAIYIAVEDVKGLVSKKYVRPDVEELEAAEQQSEVVSDPTV
jgi:multidrug efflux pump subunit AcrB